MVAASEDDTSDLTWGVLARQLREIRFLLVCRRIHFLAYSLATDYTDFAEESLPLVADHPNRAYVECAAEGYSSPDAPRKLRSLELTDFETKSKDIFVPLRNLTPDFANTVEERGKMHTNLGTVPGQIQRTKGYPDAGGRAAAAHNLLRFDPNSPLGRGVLIEANWKEAEPSVQAWENDHGGDTFVIAQLGLHALKDGKLDDAELRLEKALARSPDRWIFDGLVEVYRKKDQIDRWKKTVNQFLKSQDQNLDHAHATLDLARYMMEKGQYAEARPYAERGVVVGRLGDALGRLFRAEKLKDWKTAELWVARTSQALRLQLARLVRLVPADGPGRCPVRGRADRIPGRGGPRSSAPEEGLQVAFVYLLDGQPDVAKRLLEDLFEDKPDTTTGVWLAWACDLAGDAKARDAKLKAVATDPKPSGPKTARVVRVLADWLAKGEKSPLDLKQIDAILAEIDPKGRPNTAATVGLFLDHHGKRDEAANYLNQADTEHCYLWFRFAVRNARRARGVELAPIPW